MPGGAERQWFLYRQEPSGVSPGQVLGWIGDEGGTRQKAESGVIQTMGPRHREVW